MPHPASNIAVHCRTMSHPNVAVLYGCLLTETEAAFLHEYCSRGTLHDILNSTELELDWVFRLSFALDAAHGMSYLHERRVTHGRLDTTTCIINEQWLLKIKGTSDHLPSCMHMRMFSTKVYTFNRHV